MRNLDIETFWMCASNLGWETTVPSSDGKTNYTVKYEWTNVGPYEYGFTCTCSRLKFKPNEECKHIKEAEKKFCGWHQQHNGGEPVDGKCPKCGGEVTGVRCAV